jgi:FG-GAP repeat protein
VDTITRRRRAHEARLLCRIRSVAAGGTGLVLGAALVVAGGGTAHAAPSGVWADFNGDGYRDVVVADPSATVEGQHNAGAVSVLYGGPHGVNPGSASWYYPGYHGVPGTPAAGHGFGGATAIGDLDRDGYADLVVSSPADATRSQPTPLTILWGGPGGPGGTVTTLAYPGPVDPASGGVLFGTSLKVADFNGDGRPDLAVGTPDYYGTATASGSVLVFTSVTRTGAAHHYALPSPGNTRINVTAGDVTGDHVSDLVVQCDFHDPDSDADTLHTVLYKATRSGLVKAATLPGGDSAAIGDIDHDGIGDIVIGHPEDSRGQPGGRITVVYGSASGLPGTGRATRVFYQGTPGVPGAPEGGDRFGFAVALGDINGDGSKDLAIGIPNEAIGTTTHAGAVTVLYGSRSGLTTAHAQTLIRYDSANIFTSFGTSAGLTDTDRDGHADLLAAAPGNAQGGTVWYYRGTATGIPSTSPLPITTYNTGNYNPQGSYGSITD